MAISNGKTTSSLYYNGPLTIPVIASLGEVEVGLCIYCSPMCLCCICSHVYPRHFNGFGTHQAEPRHEKTWLMPNANNKGADQSAHPRSLISAFVVRCLDSMIQIY